MIGYTLFGTNQYERARDFYDELFTLVGAKRLQEWGNLCTWGKDWSAPMFGIAKPYDGNSATVGNGTMIAIPAGERATVDKLYAKALELGGLDEGGPGVRGEESDQAFYAAYFRDLDGNKLAVFRIGPA